MGWDGLKGASSLRQFPSPNSQAPWWLCGHRKQGECSADGGCFLRGSFQENIAEEVHRVSRRAAGRPVGRSGNQCLGSGTAVPTVSRGYW